MPYSTYTLNKLKQSETKMNANDIIRRQQEDILLLMAEKNAVEAKVKQLEKENEILHSRLAQYAEQFGKKF